MKRTASFTQWDDLKYWEYEGTLISQKVRIEGEHKYGVRFFEKETEEILEDVDPFIIVESKTLETRRAHVKY